MYRLVRVVWLTACLLAGMTASVVGQTVTITLSGHVTDASTGKPMPFANVYLNGSTRGTLTDEKGAFSLTGIPLGTAEVVASFVGYQSEKKRLRFDNTQAKTTTFRLKPSDQTLNAVTVRGNVKKWQQHLRQFKRQLLGEPFGGQCQILNSDAISFKEENGHLKATTTEPIAIENQALGYKLWYDMLYFDGTNQKVYYAGTARFEEMKPENEKQANRFRRNRMIAYQGSTRHLMATLVDSTYEQAGFLVYQENMAIPIDRDRSMHTTLTGSIKRRLLPLRIHELILPGKLPFERRLVTPKPLVVFYIHATSPYSPYADARYAYSQITLPTGQFQFTVDGTITVPEGMEIQGSLADDRLSRLLPAEWQPNALDADSKTSTPVATQGKFLPPDARLGRIATSFNDRFQALAPVLFLHTDKPFYATGDRIWFSAYLLDAATHQQPLGETAIHVDVLTASGRTVQHQWLRIEDGRGVGNFRLSDSLASGTYRLRGYTDEDDRQKRPAFERSVAVYNTLQPTTSTLTDNTPKSLDIQFLPEGGRWIVGLPARLGVKVVGTDGHGFAVSGRIVDNTGVEICRLITNRLGMGHISLTPQAGRTYYAEVVQADQQQRIPLPAVDPEGLILSVDAVSDSTRLGLTVMGKNLPSQDSAYVLIQHRGRLVDQRKILLQNGVARVSLSTATLPSGLNQITLYDATARPQAERLVFLPERIPPIKVIIGLNKQRYQPREQAILGITLNDDGRPALAALSASITDATQVPDDTAEATIHTHLLLTGELRGRVEQPNYYVKNTTSETRWALDDLLLTQGWRRVSGTPATELLGGVSLMGRVLNPQNQPIAGAQVFVASTKASQSFVKSAGADERGRFRLAGLAIADTTQLMTQLTNRQLKDLSDKEAHLVLEGPDVNWERDTTNVLPNWSALRAQLEAARMRQESDAEFYRDKKVKLLKEVIVRARKFDERPDDIRQRSLHNGADATILFDDKSPRFANLYEMIRGRAPGVSVIQNTLTNSYQVLIRGIGSLKSSTQPLFLMDGMPIQDTDGTSLLSFNPGDVERIEVLKNGTNVGIYGVRGGNGVIAFYSKRFRPDQDKSAIKPGMKPLQFIGYPSVQREFYVPRYDLKPDEAQTDVSSRVDRRDVLYWKPIIRTDSQGHSQLLFFLSDVVRTVRITVQGITADGRPVVGTELIRVQ
ncbi:carboxypeptidase-like regulatory domain-containing protein [Spirosoma validum]|uniref:Carboxypeptidase-like regulatory domain-containing protein n=1 Tax=Spirosoma validum TaxID=2771355 RepID=A0A927B8R8_9BACT|nr:carboxypeptidase-like regulatory domain-containing protein [Spirosoma validum]MBD2757836.1 carboxypeptidase-like regulatory domain-containing protein [Spirosoma validum]